MNTIINKLKQIIYKGIKICRMFYILLVYHYNVSFLKKNQLILFISLSFIKTKLKNMNIIIIKLSDIFVILL